MSRRARSLASFACLAVAAAVTAAAAGQSPDPDGAQPARASVTVHHVRPLLGFALNAHHISDLPLYLESVDRIAELGANALIIVSPMYQARVDSSEIRMIPSRCPTDAQLVAILRRGRERGLYTALLPIVLLERAGSKEWRGVIEPEDWDGWWRSYDGVIDRFLSIAIVSGVDLFSIGSELNSTEAQTDRWRRIASRVRDRFDGQITYSANWDRFNRVTFWPEVDVMSVSSYFELVRDRPGAPEAELVAAWAPIREGLLDFARAAGKPLLLSELGYPSLPTASAHPWDYVARRGQKADHAAQARCWSAFFSAWTAALTDRASPAVGVFCYRWDPYHAGEETDTGYGVEGKPAKAIIRRGFATIRGQVEDDR